MMSQEIGRGDVGNAWLFDQTGLIRSGPVWFSCSTRSQETSETSKIQSDERKEPKNRRNVKEPNQQFSDELMNETRF